MLTSMWLMEVMEVSFFMVKKLQELLDVRQKQRNGAQLVDELRKQANDVFPFHLSTQSFYFTVLC